MFQSEPRHPDSINARMRQALYWAEVEQIDANIVRLLDYLDRSGHLDNTLIVFTSDHGDMLGDHGLVNKGCRFYEGLVRFTLIFWLPVPLEQRFHTYVMFSLIIIHPNI